MQELITRVAAAAGLDAGLAEKAVGIILGFLQKEGPAAEVSQMLAAMPGADQLIASAADAPGGSGGIMGSLMGMASSVMGGGGVMALGQQLMGAGLDMGQISTVGKELVAAGREQVGEETMGAIIGSIPGLSQFV
jgi:hypothetical protein